MEKMLWVMVVFLFLGLVTGQNKDLQEFMEMARDEFRFQGMAIGAFQGRDWLLKGQVGARHADDPTPIEADDMFYLSDAGRSITAMLAARIIEENPKQVKWNSTVGEVFGAAVHPDFAESTLLDLLLHTGRVFGFGEIASDEDLIDWYDSLWTDSQWANDVENMKKRKEVARTLLNVDCHDDVCRRGIYSKFTYSIAVAMLEQFITLPFEVLLRSYIFEPLDAPNCGIGPNTLDSGLPPKQPWSHFAGPWGIYTIPVVPGNQTNMPSAIAPDDGIHCSMDSWKNILSAHLIKDESFLSAESWDILQTPGAYLYDSISYAPGFIVEKGNPFEPTLLYHPGGEQKDYAIVYLVPSQNVGLVAAANSYLQDGMRQKVGFDRVLEFVGNNIGKYTGTTVDLFSRAKTAPFSTD